jgi:hypothetical protein
MLRRTISLRLSGCIAVTLCLGVSATASHAQGLHAKIQQRLADSEKPRDVPGGSTFTVPMPVDQAFNKTVKYFPLQDVAIDEASKKELGQIVTAIKVVKVGGFRNNEHGYRTYVTFVKDTDNSTIVKVKVAMQMRSNHLQPDPWGDPKIQEKETAETLENLKAALSGS